MIDESFKNDLNRFEKVSIYVVPHADDWQLFMQPNAYTDLVSGKCKTVFIITTAGDAGLSEIYWRGREEGCKSSVRFCLVPMGVIAETEGDRTANGHLISYWSFNNVNMYFLRLPDGSKDGSGFAVSNFDSLLKLHEGKIGAIACLDQSTVYNSWSDFTATIQSIVDFERGTISNAWINYLNPDNIVNPNDHSDHIITGHAIQNISALDSFHQVLYTGYNGVNQTGMSFRDMFWKVGMFAAYEQEVYIRSGYSTLAEDIDTYLNWCSRNAILVHIGPGQDKVDLALK